MWIRWSTVATHWREQLEDWKQPLLLYVRLWFLNKKLLLLFSRWTRKMLTAKSGANSKAWSPTMSKWENHWKFIKANYLILHHFAKWLVHWRSNGIYIIVPWRKQKCWNMVYHQIVIWQIEGQMEIWSNYGNNQWLFLVKPLNTDVPQWHLLSILSK